MTAIRQATSTDAEFLSKIILQAGRSHTGTSIWDIAIGRSESEILGFLQRLTTIGVGHFCHTSRFLVAEDSGVAISAAASYITDADMFSRTHAGLVETAAGLGWDEQRTRAMFEGMMCWSKAVPPIPPNAFVIEWLATLPGFQGRGFAAQLLDEHCERARGQGFNTVYLHMQAGNKVAQSLYERKNFAVVDEKSDAEFRYAVGNSGLVLMAADL